MTSLRRVLRSDAQRPGCRPGKHIVAYRKGAKRLHGRITSNFSCFDMLGSAKMKLFSSRAPVPA